MTEYGKVKVIHANGFYVVSIGAGHGENYTRIFSTKAAAYNEAKWLRSSFRMGRHPGAIVSQQGYAYNTNLAAN